jgi:hypothetical protein
LDTWAENKRKETFIHISNSYINCGYFEEWLSDNNKK